MITMDQIPSHESNRVILRPLTPVASRSGAVVLRRANYLSLPPVDMQGLSRILRRPVAIPNWMLAVTVAAALGVSTTLSSGMLNAPARSASVAAPPVAVPVSLSISPGRFDGALAAAIIKQGPTSDPKVAALNTQIQSMNTNLQDLQRQNDALRNLTRQQSSDLTSAESNLAASRDLLNGETQDLGGRLSAMQQEVESQVPGLQSGLNAAADLVNQIRKLFGMPSVTIP